MKTFKGKWVRVEYYTGDVATCYVESENKDMVWFDNDPENNWAVKTWCTILDPQPKKKPDYLRKKSKKK
jgi:hypothetical protein